MELLAMLVELLYVPFSFINRPTIVGEMRVESSAPRPDQRLYALGYSLLPPSGGKWEVILPAANPSTDPDAVLLLVRTPYRWARQLSEPKQIPKAPPRPWIAISAAGTAPHPVVDEFLPAMVESRLPLLAEDGVVASKTVDLVTVDSARCARYRVETLRSQRRPGAPPTRCVATGFYCSDGTRAAAVTRFELRACGQDVERATKEGLALFQSVRPATSADDPVPPLAPR